jgi:hypothetical protein
LAQGPPAPVPSPAQAPAAANAPKTAKDSAALRDSLIRVDSVARAKRDSLEKADTLRAPFARAEVPRERDLGPAYHWDRAALASTGALSLAELLDRVPGASGYRTAWLVDPSFGGYAGGFGRVRIYVDGVELDPIDPRGVGVNDLQLIQLVMYEDLLIERAGDEIRVHLRTWRTEKRYPQTRVDILTGDRSANTFRGYYASRFKNGLGLQAAFSNSSLQSGQGGDGQLQSYLVRGGWAGGRWSFDVFAQRTSNDRKAQIRYDGLGTMTADRPTQTLAYMRAGYGDPDRDIFWAQGVVASEAFRQSPASSGVPSIFGSTSADTTTILRRASRIQYVAASGLRLGPLAGSLTARVRVYDRQRYFSPLARATFDQGWLGASLTAERIAEDSVTREDASVRFTPFNRIGVVGTLSQVDRTYGGVSRTERHWRGEAGVRLRGALWVTGGVIHRDSVPFLHSPVYADSSFATAAGPAANGTFAAIRGDLFRDLKIDAQIVAWDKADQNFYLPRAQARTQLYIQSDWRSYFPSGSFGWLFAVIHTYRGSERFPVIAGVNSDVPMTTPILRDLSTLMEIKLLSAVISWQFRNALRRDQVQLPGYLGLRGQNYYGVRWDFKY